MNLLTKKIYHTLNVYERNVFKCFYNIYKPQSNNKLDTLKEFVIVLMLFLFCKWQRYVKKDIYFRYLEVPVTTRCSLNCKECNNLIQVYQDPVDFKADHIIQDIRHICSISKRIYMIRILGGEPLLHFQLAKVLRVLDKLEKVERVVIVTNGTQLFDEKALLILSKNKKFSVDISNYGKYSTKYEELIDQLDKKNIFYITQKEQKSWKSISYCGNRGRSEKRKKKVFSLCREDCHSLLNGELHICPRSSHGTDLGLIRKRNTDYVAVRDISGKRDLKKRVYKLLNTKTIEACNYCDMFQLDKLKSIPSAEQITKKEALKLMKNWKEGKCEKK